MYGLSERQSRYFTIESKYLITAKDLVSLVFCYKFPGAFAELAGEGAGEVGGLGETDLVGYFCNAVLAGHQQVGCFLQTDAGDEIVGGLIGQGF